MSSAIAEGWMTAGLYLTSAFPAIKATSIECIPRKQNVWIADHVEEKHRFYSNMMAQQQFIEIEKAAIL